MHQGDESYGADDWAACREGSIELRLLMAKADTNSDGGADYLVYQNQLMDNGLSGAERKQIANARWVTASQAKVGSTIVCAGCGCSFVKKSYQHKFCGKKTKGRSTCKDFINNWFTPTRLERTEHWIKEARRYPS